MGPAPRMAMRGASLRDMTSSRLASLPAGRIVCGGAKRLKGTDARARNREAGEVIDRRSRLSLPGGDFALAQRDEVAAAAPVKASFERRRHLSQRRKGAKRPRPL